jgi:hypothetical protein
MRIEESRESQMQLAVIRREMMHRAKVARCTGHDRIVVRKASIRNFKRDIKNQRMDLAEGSIPSKTKKELHIEEEPVMQKHRPRPLLTELTGIHRVSLGTSAHREVAVRKHRAKK